MSVGMRDQRVANVSCWEFRGGYPFSAGVRLNSSRGIELGYGIARPDKVRCEVAGVVIPLLTTVIVAVVVL